MRSKLLILLLICGVGAVHSAQAEDSLEDLLKQADSALNRGSRGPAGNQEVPIRQEPNREDAPTQTPKKRNKGKAPSSPSTATHPSENDTSSAIQALENPQIDEIVSLDIKYQEAERAAARNYAAVSLLAGIHTLGTGFEMEKDEDVFTVDRKTDLPGLALQFHTPRSTFGRANAYWGYEFGARAGFFSGDVAISRRGVVNDNRAYQYQLIPVDLFAALSYKPRPFVELQLMGGGGADFYYQKGEEDVDTLTDVGTGAILGFATYIHISQRVSVVGLINRRGFSAESSGKSIAGTTIALGTQIGLFF